MSSDSSFDSSDSGIENIKFPTESEMQSNSSVISNKVVYKKPVIGAKKVVKVNNVNLNDSLNKQIGGVKVAKKPKYDPLYLQRLIDHELRERIPIDAFKQEKLVTQVKNTVGIKCKQCGSENVYVESKQVRSADEAMTKFYTCLNCGNKWRFD